MPLLQKKDENENKVFMNTSVSKGRAKAVITDIGMNTEIGKIATMIQEVDKDKTPLEIKIEKQNKISVNCRILLFKVIKNIYNVYTMSRWECFDY